MELKILEDTKNKLVFDLLGENQTVLAALSKELWNDEHVKGTGYHIEHPLINTPRFVVETDGENPRKVIQTAIKRLQKAVEKLQDQTKEIK